MSEPLIPIITLDGPSGTGKGTLCQQLANHLKWNILDSGSIYRVLAFAARRNKISFDKVDVLVDLATNLDFNFKLCDKNSTITLLNNEDVSSQIRSEQCGQDASLIAAQSEIRRALLERQRQFAKAPGLVTDGRDMGTVVFPNAFLKIFLYASPEERANRRFLQLKEKGNDVSLAQVVEELRVRDSRDIARTHAPLKAAEDAIEIDTTKLNIVQSFATVLRLVDERIHSI